MCLLGFLSALRLRRQEVHQICHRLWLPVHAQRAETKVDFCINFFVKVVAGTVASDRVHKERDELLLAIIRLVFKDEWVSLIVGVVLDGQRGDAHIDLHVVLVLVEVDRDVGKVRHKRPL